MEKADAFPVVVSRRAVSRIGVAPQYFVDVFIAIAIKSFARQVATNASVAAGAQDDTSAKEIAMAETNEDPLALTGEDPVVETGKASVAATSETQVAETGEEHPAVMDFENLQKLGNGGGEAAASAASSFAGCFQMFADEVRRQSKKRRPRSRASRHRL